MRVFLLGQETPVFLVNQKPASTLDNSFDGFSERRFFWTWFWVCPVTTANVRVFHGESAGGTSVKEWWKVAWTPR